MPYFISTTPYCCRAKSFRFCQVLLVSLGTPSVLKKKKKKWSHTSLAKLSYSKSKIWALFFRTDAFVDCRFLRQGCKRGEEERGREKKKKKMLFLNKQVGQTTALQRVNWGQNTCTTSFQTCSQELASIPHHFQRSGIMQANIPLFAWTYGAWTPQTVT